MANFSLHFAKFNFNDWPFSWKINVCDLHKLLLTSKLQQINRKITIIANCIRCCWSCQTTCPYAPNSENVSLSCRLCYQHNAIYCGLPWGSPLFACPKQCVQHVGLFWSWAIGLSLFCPLVQCIFAAFMPFFELHIKKRNIFHKVDLFDSSCTTSLILQ